MKPKLACSLGDPVVALAWSPDSRHLAAAGISGPTAILDAASLRVVHPLAGHDGGTFTLDWSARGDLLATGGADGRVRLWDANTGALRRHLPGGADWVEQAVFSPDGDRLATRAGRYLRVWQAGEEPVFEFSRHESTVTALAWRADSEAIASGCYGRIRAWRLGESQPCEDIPWKGSFLSLAWNPTGRFLCGGTQEGTIQFFRLPAQQNEPLRMSGYPSKIRNLAWDWTGRWLASDGGPVVVAWDVSGQGPANRKPVELEGHPGKINTLQYQPAGPLLATGCEQGAVLVWDPSRTVEPVHAAPWPSGIHALRWSPDGRWLAVGCQDGSIGLTAAADFTGGAGSKGRGARGS